MMRAPTPTQAPLIHLPTEGQFLVRGAAGSGKSFVALERALHLARQPLLHGSPRVLLLARTPALAQAFADSLRARDGGRAKQVEVGAPASWCRAILGESDAQPPLDDATFARLVGEALDLVRRTSRRSRPETPPRATRFPAAGRDAPSRCRHQERTAPSPGTC